MLTGVLPFSGKSQLEVALKHVEDTPRPPADVNPAIPPALSRIVMRAMQKDPAKRYASAGEMMQAIRDTLKKPDAAVEPPAVKPETIASAHRNNRINMRTTRLLWSRRALTIIFTTLLLLVIGLLVTNVVRGVIHTLANHIVMPAVTNYTWDTASQKLEELGLVVHRRDKIVDIGNENLVIEQSAVPGELLTRGSDVTLTVSKGEYDIIMPDFTHKTLNEALKDLSDLNLSLGVQERIVSQVAVGQVVSQMPAAGTMVRYGASVMLTVSGGLMVMPDLRGMTEQTAREWLKSDGQLVLSEVLYQTVNDSAMDGVVVSQSPEVAKQVMLQTPITLTVGKLDQRVYLAETVVSLRLTKSALISGTLVKPDGEEELQYCAIHPAGESTARFLVRGAIPGAHTLRIYNENELIQNLTIILE
jgi:serine/threonine-protein kinase